MVAHKMLFQCRLDAVEASMNDRLSAGEWWSIVAQSSRYRPTKPSTVRGVALRLAVSAARVRVACAEFLSTVATPSNDTPALPAQR